MFVRILYRILSRFMLAYAVICLLVSLIYESKSSTNSHSVSTLFSILKISCGFSVISRNKMTSVDLEPMPGYKLVPTYKPLSAGVPSSSLPTVARKPETAANSSNYFFFFLGLAYFSAIFFAWHSASKANSISALQSPWIGQQNATKLINQRLQFIEDKFEKALRRNDWTVLRMVKNVTIEKMNSDDGSWPIYIKTTAIFDAQPEDVFKHLGWQQFDETQRKVDRFHESASLIFPPSHKAKVVRKV
jgi:hypothetical protein